MRLARGWKGKLMRPLYVELSPEDRTAVERLAAASGAAEGRPVSISAVVRALIREAAKRKTPIRVAE
jgi:hypothetical protein